VLGDFVWGTTVTL